MERAVRLVNDETREFREQLEEEISAKETCFGKGCQLGNRSQVNVG
jgi:hypothetical protein